MVKSAFYRQDIAGSPPAAAAGAGQHHQHLRQSMPMPTAASAADARAALDVEARVQQAYVTRSSSAQSLNSGWRFPSSRKFLWDRTPMGPAEHLQPRVGRGLGREVYRVAQKGMDGGWGSRVEGAKACSAWTGRRPAGLNPARACRLQEHTPALVVPSNLHNLVAQNGTPVGKLLARFSCSGKQRQLEVALGSAHAPYNREL